MTRITASTLALFVVALSNYAQTMTAPTQRVSSTAAKTPIASMLAAKSRTEADETAIRPKSLR